MCVRDCALRCPLRFPRRAAEDSCGLLRFVVAKLGDADFGCQNRETWLSHLMRTVMVAPARISRANHSRRFSLAGACLLLIALPAMARPRDDVMSNAFRCAPI